jgi:hypothetical protein
LKRIASRNTAWREQFPLPPNKRSNMLNALQKCLHRSWRQGYKIKVIRERFPNQTDALTDAEISAEFGEMIRVSTK